MVDNATEDKKKSKGKPQQPDRDEHNEMIAVIEKRIAELKTEQQGIRQKIGSKSEGKTEYQSRKNDMQIKLREYEEIIQKHEADKTKCWAEIKGSQAAVQANNKMMKSMRSQQIPELGNKSVHSIDDINREIEKIEYDMQTKTMSLKEEKAKLELIKKLKGLKPRFQQLEAAANNMGGNKDSVVGPLKERIDQLSHLINEAREAKKQQKIQFERLKEQREKVTRDMPELFEKADAITKQLGNEHMKKRALLEDFKRREREYNAVRAEERQAKYDRQRADRLERQADNEARRVARREEQEEEQPFLYETTLIEQTLSYCQNLLPKEKVEVVVEEKAAPDAQIDGRTVLLSKKEREEDFFFSGGKSKSKNKTKGKKKTTEVSENDKIKHTVESIQIFSTLKIAPPVKVSDIPACMEKLSKQLETYQEKVVKWKASEEERRIAQEKAVAEAQKNLEVLRTQAREAREASKKKEAEAAAKAAEEEGDAEE
jgi:hypothetical protein